MKEKENIKCTKFSSKTVDCSEPGMISFLVQFALRIDVFNQFCQFVGVKGNTMMYAMYMELSSLTRETNSGARMQLHFLSLSSHPT